MSEHKLSGHTVLALFLSFYIKVKKETVKNSVLIKYIHIC